MNICIFCGARLGIKSEFGEDARKLAYGLASKKCNLVYGGGKSGLMGLIADQFLNQNRTVIGVRPDFLIKNELSHLGISEMISVPDMNERKQKMIELSDTFIALPGGIGTLDELMDVITQVKINYINKPIKVLNTNGIYDDLIRLFDKMIEAGFLDQKGIEKVQFYEKVEDLLSSIS